MYSILLLAAMGSGGASLDWHEPKPYGTGGLDYMYGCYGSPLPGAAPCPSYGYGLPPPGGGYPSFGPPGLPPGGDMAPFNPGPLWVSSPRGTDRPPSGPAVAPGGLTDQGAGLMETTAAGRIVVDLPADARLVIGGWDSPPGRPTRTFVTPALGPGRDYGYSLRAEVVRAGVTLTAAKEVTIRAGQEVHVALELPGPESLPARLAAP
jgi:uncharacterized protein (TIGR03000 family)